MRIIWPLPVRLKLFSYRSIYFTPEETREYLENLIGRIEESLPNTTIRVRYREETGKYRGVTRLIIDKFKFYYKTTNTDIIIIGIKFPGDY